MSKVAGKTKAKKLRRVAFNKKFIADFLEHAGDTPLGFALWCQEESSGTCSNSKRQRRQVRHRLKFFGLRSYQERKARLKAKDNDDKENIDTDSSVIAIIGMRSGK